MGLTNALGEPSLVFREAAGELGEALEAKDDRLGFFSGVLTGFRAAIGAVALTGDFFWTGAFGVVGVLGAGDLAGLGDGFGLVMVLLVEIAAGTGFVLVEVGFATVLADGVVVFAGAGPVDPGLFAPVPLVLLLAGAVFPETGFPFMGLPLLFTSSFLSAGSASGVRAGVSKAFSGMVSVIRALFLLASISTFRVSFVSAISFGCVSVSMLKADLRFMLSLLLLSLRTSPIPPVPPTAMKLVLTFERGRGEAPFLLLAKRSQQNFFIQLKYYNGKQFSLV